MGPYPTVYSVYRGYITGDQIKGPYFRIPQFGVKKGFGFGVSLGFRV